MYDAEDFAQPIAMWIGVSLAVFFGLPYAFGGIAESRISSGGTCTGDITIHGTGFWDLMVSGTYNSCPVSHNTDVLRGQLWAGLVILAILMCVASYYMINEGPIGADDALEAIGVAIVGSVVLAIALFFLLVWMIVIAFSIMIGIVIVIAFTSGSS